MRQWFKRACCTLALLKKLSYKGDREQMVTLAVFGSMFGSQMIGVAQNTAEADGGFTIIPLSDFASWRLRSLRLIRSDSCLSCCGARKKR